MNDMIFSPIDKRQLIQEIAEEVASRIIPQLQPPAQEDELIQIPQAMRLPGRSRTTINNWSRESFLIENIAPSVYSMGQFLVLKIKSEKPVRYPSEILIFPGPSKGKP